ncbi:MAG TPA: ABC transporter permease [Planctomycetaceae bacterium]|jgi:ABC-2 type transport system permease protein|nr:ABC transporter permease [Planctomycetaceae bacterium]
MKSWEITKKDIRLLTRDVRALFVLLVLPMIFITIIGLTMGKLFGWRNTNQLLHIGVVNTIAYDQIGGPGWDEDDQDAKTAAPAAKPAEQAAKTAAAPKAGGEPVLDAEEKIRQKEIAHNIVVKVINQLQKRSGFEITEILTSEQAETDVKNATIQAAIVFGPNFYRRVSHLTPSDILDGQLKEGLESLDVSLLAVDPGSSTSSLIQQLANSEIFKTIVPAVMCRYTLHRRFMSNTCNAFDTEADAPILKVETAKPQTVVRDGDVYKAIVPSYTVFFVFFLVNFMARSVLHEREIGTLRRLRIAPISPISLLAGKTLPFLFISLIQTAILFVCGRLLFAFSWGTEPLMLIPVIVSTSLAATALGLLVATLVRSESQVSAYATILVITMGGISGCFTPRQWLPDAMREFSLTTPHAWSLIAYDELLTKAVPDPRIVFESCAMLVAFAVVFFIAGSMRFRTVE